MTREPASPPLIPDYELLKPIGRGSYGEVWLARSVTGVFRVIKVVRRDRFDNERPFLRELEGITRFQSAVSGRPRQLALLHVGRNVEAGYFYYVMEPADDVEAGSEIDPERYVPLTLKELFSRRGRLPPGECVQLALELARGLSVLHEANLIHRDIKPSNIIFVQQVPKLADVGLVAVSEATMTMVGTPGYVPPEGPGFVTADIYSLGKVLYELATGLDRMEFPRLPSDVIDGGDVGLLREINSIVLRACHPDPKERQPSAAAFARELELVQAGKSVLFYEGLRQRLRAFAVGAGILGMLAVIAGVVAGFLIWRSDVLKRANEQARRALYRSDLAVAQLAKASGDLGRARAALARQVPGLGEKVDLRGLEWAILNREVRGEGMPLEGGTDTASIRKLATDRTGRWVAASFADDRVGVWDLETGKLVRMIERARVLGGFTPDGRIVVDEPVRALRFEYPTNGPTTRIETGQRLLTLLPDTRSCVVSPAPGDIVFSLLDSDGHAGGSLFNVAAHWRDFGVSGSDVSADGKWLALGLVKESGARRERWLASVDLSTGTERWRRVVSGRIVWIRCSGDAIHFVVNVGGLTPNVFRLDQDKPAIELHGHTARVQDAAFASDGSRLATAGADQTVRIWDVGTGSLISTHRGLGRPATAVAWSFDGKFVVAGDDAGNVRIFPLPPREVPIVLSGFYGDVHGDMVCSPGAEHFAVTTTAGTIALVSTKELRVVKVLDNLFQPIAFSADSRFIWAFANDWTVKRVNFESDIREDFGTLVPIDFSVVGWAVSPDLEHVALSGTQGRFVFLRLRERDSFRGVEPDTNTVWGLAFTPDSKELWTGSSSGFIRRHQLSDGAVLQDVAKLDGEVQALALSNDGRWAAAALYNDASVRIWDCLRNRWLPALVEHRRFVQSLIFTADNNRLISGGADGRVVIWRVPEFEEIAAFEVEQPESPTGDEGIAVLRLAPNASVLGALTEDGRLKVWRTY